VRLGLTTFGFRFFLHLQFSHSSSSELDYKNKTNPKPTMYRRQRKQKKVEYNNKQVDKKRVILNIGRGDAKEALSGLELKTRKSHRTITVPLKPVFFSFSYFVFYYIRRKIREFPGEQ
jgi:hypothetical protein